MNEIMWRQAKRPRIRKKTVCCYWCMAPRFFRVCHTIWASTTTTTTTMLLLKPKITTTTILIIINVNTDSTLVRKFQAFASSVSNSHAFVVVCAFRWKSRQKTVAGFRLYWVLRLFRLATAKYPISMVGCKQRADQHYNTVFSSTQRSI